MVAALKIWRLRMRIEVTTDDETVRVFQNSNEIMTFSRDENIGDIYYNLINMFKSLGIEVNKTTESTEIQEPWQGSPEETRIFLDLAESYLAGDTSIYPADDPNILALGFLQDNGIDPPIMAMAK